MNKIIIAIIFTISLCSCKVCNEYHLPKIVEKVDFRDIYSTENEISISDISWCDFFSDPYLYNLINEALLNNYDMLIASEKIKQAEAINGMARAAYFPDLDMSAKFEQNRLSNINPTTGELQSNKSFAYHKDNYSLGIVTSWELDLWGKLKHNSKAKYAEMLNSYVGKHLVKTSLISSIANSYYTLLSLDKQLEITEEMIKSMEENLNATIILQETGYSNSAAVEQTKALLYETKATIPELKHDIFQLENSICSLVGRMPENIMRSSIDKQHFPSKISTGIPIKMISRRPDVQEAELNVRIAFEQTKVAKANFYPAIVLNSGTIGYSSINSISNFFSPEKMFLNIVAGITQPIFNKKKNITQYKVAKSEQQISLISFQKKVLDATIEVSNIFDLYLTTIEKYDLRNIQIEALCKAVKHTGLLMRAGESTYLEVLTAQQGLLKVKLAQTADQLQKMQTITDLYHALGGG